jgi:hypothetical protein
MDKLREALYEIRIYQNDKNALRLSKMTLDTVIAVFENQITRKQLKVNISKDEYFRGSVEDIEELIKLFDSVNSKCTYRKHADIITHWQPLPAPSRKTKNSHFKWLFLYCLKAASFD